MPNFKIVQSLNGRSIFRQFPRSVFVSCVLSAITLAPQNSKAGIYADLSLAPIYEKANASVRSGGGSWEGEGAVGTSTKLGYDLRATLGVTVFNTILVGGSVNTLSANLTRPAVGDDTNKTVNDSRMEYGVALGVVRGGFHFIGTYLLDGTRSQTVNETEASGTLAAKTDAKDSGGKGFLISIGYAFQVTSGWRIGPSLIYREVTYDKQTLTNSVTPASSYNDRAYLSKPVEAAFTPFLTSRFEF